VTLKDKSWKTSLAGSLNSLSTMLIGAGVIPGMTDMAYAQKMHVFIIIGFVLKAAAEFLQGMVGRDNDKCSEDVGLVCTKKNGLPTLPTPPPKKS
jgi:hypothetical protein